jgi:hypothetical protein
MKLSDIQFAKYFLSPMLPSEELCNVLDKKIDIQSGETDSVVVRDGSISYCSPSSITMFLFTLLYNILSPRAINGTTRDMLGLGLLQMCHEYIYNDGKLKADRPPVVVSMDKLPIPSIIIREIVEPIVGKINVCQILFSPCNFTDAARIIDSSSQLSSEYDNYRLRRDLFPVILVNDKIDNHAAVQSHLFKKIMDCSFGSEKSNGMIRSILLNDSIMSHLISILKMLNGDPGFIVDFMEYLESNIDIQSEDLSSISDVKFNIFSSDDYLRKYVKVADQTGQSIQINKQWSQWSMLMGLIEKQLEPMRGSMWPASENIKPHEDKLRAIIKERSDQKGKNQANFEEMLQCARDTYNHNAVEPGHLIEMMLKENRVWKQ